MFSQLCPTFPQQTAYKVSDWKDKMTLVQWSPSIYSYAHHQLRTSAPLVWFRALFPPSLRINKNTLFRTHLNSAVPSSAQQLNNRPPLSSLSLSQQRARGRYRRSLGGRLRPKGNWGRRGDGGASVGDNQFLMKLTAYRATLSEWKSG